MTKLKHPCAQTCSGYQQGYEQGYEDGKATSVEIQLRYSEQLFDRVKLEDELGAKLKLAREALKFYADKKTWYESIDYHIGIVDVDHYISDGIHYGGKKAREALEKLK